MTYKKAKEDGFTIVEIVVVMFMFAMSVIMISSLFSYIQYAQRNVQYLDIATRAARAEVEYLRNGKYMTLVSGTSLDFTSRLPETLPGGSTGVVTVSIPSGMTGLKKIDVKVEWPVGTSTKSTVLSAIVGDSGLTE